MVHDNRLIRRYRVVIEELPTVNPKLGTTRRSRARNALPVIAVNRGQLLKISSYLATTQMIDEFRPSIIEISLSLRAHLLFDDEAIVVIFASRLSFLAFAPKGCTKIYLRSRRSCVTLRNIMKGNTTPPHDPAELGELEHDVLLIVWRCGFVTADQVRENLDRPLKDSTVRTILRRLEEKGYVAHSVDDRTFVYRPAESRQRVAGRAAKRIVDWFCEGSVETLLVGLVDSKVLDRAELQRLADHIAIAQKAVPSDKKEAL